MTDHPGGPETPHHDLSGPSATLRRVEALAAQVVEDHYDVEGATPRLLEVSENATFLLERAGDPVAVLRVHRLGYHSRAEIESELSWSSALRRDAGVRTPAVLAARDGSLVVEATEPRTATQRHCVLFEYVPGCSPAEDDAAGFERLGALVARMHRHARSWRPPAGFARFRWDLRAAVGPTARWGPWRDAPGVGPAEEPVLDRLERALAERLGAFGTDPARFGLVHADTRLANVLAEGSSLTVIDFDDCGWSWYLYDLGTAFSFFEHEPQVPELVDRWLTGYRHEGEIPAADTAEIWTFILLRRLMLLGWIGTHGGAAVARQLGATFAEGTCALADRYLSASSPSA